MCIICYQHCWLHICTSCEDLLNTFTPTMTILSHLVLVMLSNPEMQVMRPVNGSSSVVWDCVCVLQSDMDLPCLVVCMSSYSLCLGNIVAISSTTNSRQHFMNICALQCQTVDTDQQKCMTKAWIFCDISLGTMRLIWCCVWCYFPDCVVSYLLVLWWWEQLWSLKPWFICHLFTWCGCYPECFSLISGSLWQQYKD
jgi:hypothetical protein